MGHIIHQSDICTISRALHYETAKLIIVRTLDYGELTKAQLQKRYKYLKDNISLLQDIQSENLMEYISVDHIFEDRKINIAMEFVPGGSLRKILDYFITFKERLVKIYTLQILQGLNELHSRGIVHGDLKLNNVYVDDLGTIKLGDYGFIKQTFCLTEKYTKYNSRITNESLYENDDFDRVYLPRIGSEIHTPPEIVRDKKYSPDYSYDIWCLGLVIYEMLAGKSYFEAFEGCEATLFEYFERANEELPIKIKLTDNCK